MEKLQEVRNELYELNAFISFHYIAFSNRYSKTELMKSDMLALNGKIGIIIKELDEIIKGEQKSQEN
jgi:hypothetical protein